MASVSSLDQDMRNLRLSRYTSSASNEVRTYIEETLGERLPPGDLLDALKDGVALCKLASLALGPPGIKYKQSQMPFMQMENISHFLRACESPPLNMAAHDRFLTVDLYEGKDPAQVLQCLGAFSRVANATNPVKFPTTIGPKRAGTLSPSSNGATSRNGATSPYVTSNKSSAAVPSARPMSPHRTGGSTTSSNADGLKSAPVSSWSRKTDQGATSPAWNIAQYGYMGGASQGNQGVAFGARRQITSAGPNVPSLAEKERKRREREAEEDRLRQQAEEAERKRAVEREAEEAQERISEERKWEQETKRVREEERRRLDEQKRQWEEQERRWKAEEEARQKEEAEIQKATRPRGKSDARLRGQYLSQYQAEEPQPSDGEVDTPERRRVQELEKQLEEARERERQYQLEREQRSNSGRTQPQFASIQEQDDRPTSSSKDSEASWAPDEREYLRQAAPSRSTGLGSARPLPVPSAGKTPGLPSRPLPEPEAAPSPPRRSEQASVSTTAPAPAESRPLPDPSHYQPRPPAQNRTEQFLAETPAPEQSKPRVSHPAEMGYSTTMEQQADTDKRMASQQKTKAGGWASKSLLEREMERERERQKEWEANQETSRSAPRDNKQGSAPGQSWDVHQYGYTGGDSQNKGSSTGSGIGFGGRRQIIGPRPPP